MAETRGVDREPHCPPNRLFRLPFPLDLHHGTLAPERKQARRGRLERRHDDVTLLQPEPLE